MFCYQVQRNFLLLRGCDLDGISDGLLFLYPEHKVEARHGAVHAGNGAIAADVRMREHTHVAF